MQVGLGSYLKFDVFDAKSLICQIFIILGLAVKNALFDHIEDVLEEGVLVKELLNCFQLTNTLERSLESQLVGILPEVNGSQRLGQLAILIIVS